MNEYALALDLAKAKERQQQTIFVRQGDRNATTIVATITDHGAAAATSGLTARFQMRLPDGTHYYRKAASLSGNVATVALDETQAASVAGRTDVAYFQLLQGSTVVASTESFTVVVLPDALADADVAESYDSAIQDAIDALDAAVEQMPDMVEDVLEQHPEWTTTVQDGSITKAKLATDLARDRERLLYRLDNLLTAQLPEGDVATATDAAKTPVAGLALYGRSTQDGTPTPSAPVAIESVAGNLYNLTRQVDGVNVAYSNMRNLSVEDETLTFVAGTANPYYNSNQSSGSQYTSTTGMLIPVEAGEKYVICASDTSFNQFVVTAYDASKVALGYTVNTGSGGTYVYTAPASAAYIVVRFGTTTATVGQTYSVQLAIYHGSTPLPYVPYGHAGLWARRTSDASTYTVTPIDLDGHELRSLPDGTRDELTVDERGHAVLVQRVGVAEIGAADWTANSNRYRASITSYGVGTPSGGYDNTRCTAYAPTANTTAQQPADTIRLSADGNYAWLGASSTRVDSTLLYPLATPVTIDLGYVAAVPLVGPDLTAQAVPSAPMQLTYERDLNTTLARLESAIATLA